MSSKSLTTSLDEMLNRVNWVFPHETANHFGIYHEIWHRGQLCPSAVTCIAHFTADNSLMQLVGGTARWLQLQPSSSWPRPTVSAFQYFRWCALTKLQVSHFLHQICNLSKEEALQSLLMSLSSLVFWLFDVENIRRHDGCNKWWRWLQLMFREGWRGLHDSFDELVTLITPEICFEYFF